MTKIKDKYDSKFKSFTRNLFNDTEYGFEGHYINKDLGLCLVNVTQDTRENYYLMLDIIINGIEYGRHIKAHEERMDKQTLISLQIPHFNKRGGNWYKDYTSLLD
jgi:hypothetical protein